MLYFCIIALFFPEVTGRCTNNVVFCTALFNFFDAGFKNFTD